MHNNLIQKSEYDVVVVGGGVAGVAAAVAASRNGAKTLLLEKACILGGLATLGLISWYEPLCDGMGKQMISGIAEELLKLSIKYGPENLPKKWGGEGKNPIHYDRYATKFSPTIFAIAMVDYLKQNNVDLLFDALATYPKMEDGLVKGIVVETVGGSEFYPTKVVVDASGTAVICDRAGVPTEIGENYFSYVTHDLNKDSIDKITKSNDFANGRKWRGIGSDLAGNGHPENLKTLHGVTAEDVTQYMMLGAEVLLERLKSEDKESRDIMKIPGMPQYRKIRRIIGEYEFLGTEDNVKFDNAVGSFGDFRKPGRHFQLPYTALYNKNFPNIYAAGRIISAKGEGWEITRVIPVAAFTGEVAGTAAALCIKTNADANTLDVKMLQATLKQAGNLFE